MADAASHGSVSIARLIFGYAARIPVVILMFFAMRGNWGTHYDAVPPESPAAMFLTLAGILLACGPAPDDRVDRIHDMGGLTFRQHSNRNRSSGQIGRTGIARS